MRRPEVTGFVTVSPPHGPGYDYSFLAPCPASGLIINGLKDRVSAPEDTVTLVEKLHEQKGITITHQEVPEANHFFEGDNLNTLLDSTETYVKRRLTENTR
jgi:alpha/beta superfamily hydrolase